MPTRELAWEPLETTGLELNSITTALSFAGAYLVIGSDEEDLYHVARSKDGRHWSTTPIGSMVQPCAGWVPRPDSTVYAAASDSLRVVLAGIEFAKSPRPCDAQHAVAWVSADGLSWRRSTGFGAVDDFGLATAVWAVPAGWEVLVNSGTGETSIWRSPDGLEWLEVGVVAQADWEGLSVAVGAASGGTRLMAHFNSQPDPDTAIGGLLGGESRLQASVDGVHWTRVDLSLPVGRGVPPGGIIGPGPAGPSTWLLVADAEEDKPTTTYTSDDLQRWEQGTFPRHYVEHLAVTRYGFIATGRTMCPPGSDCRPDPGQYLSTDGLQWTPFASSAGSAVIVDGPAGVLAVSSRGSDVWRLRP